MSMVPVVPVVPEALVAGRRRLFAFVVDHLASASAPRLWYFGHLQHRRPW